MSNIGSTAAAPRPQIGELDTTPAPRRPYLPKTRRASLVQRLHALAILLLPTLAVFVAARTAWRGEVALWEPALALTLYFFTTLGVTVGFHRLYSHRAFQAGRGVRTALSILGSMAAQGPLIYWVSNHRRHHRYSDVAGDPHSPYHIEEQSISGWSGFWHAHVGWTFTHLLTNPMSFCKELLQDRQAVWVNRHYYTWVLLGLALPALAGAAIERSALGAWHGLLWGGGVRLFITYHVTSSINSVTHIFGYRSFATPEDSRNTWWLGLPTLGEAWHNNHHAYQSSAIFGLAWWEVDIGGTAVRFLEATGLAWGVRKPSAPTLERMRLRAAKPETTSGSTADGDLQ